MISKKRLSISGKLMEWEISFLTSRKFYAISIVEVLFVIPRKKFLR
jgi:hypothetical protein